MKKNTRDRLLEEMKSGKIKTETIPYEVALIGDRELTEDEIEYGKELESLALECLRQFDEEEILETGEFELGRYSVSYRYTNGL